MNSKENKNARTGLADILQHAVRKACFSRCYSCANFLLFISKL